ncbi:MAG: HD domain-containing protein [Candidatus Aminicenantes bacterium]|nr:HD domain-containing protein [Candidatus Aminicenantes bacterium]
MKIEVTFLRSKVARRIFFLFVACTLIPIAALAILSFGLVTKQLINKSQEQLREESKNIGQSIVRDLQSIQVEMEMIASNLSASSTQTLSIPSQEFDAHLKERFTGLILITEDDQHRVLFGLIPDAPRLGQDDRQDILLGKPGLFTRVDPEEGVRIFMCIATYSDLPNKEILLAEIDLDHFWAPREKDKLQKETELSVLDSSNNPLYSTLDFPATFPAQAVMSMKNAHSAQFEWVYEKKRYLASFFTVFLPGQFVSDEWAVVLSMPKSSVLRVNYIFAWVFPLVILVSLWVVSLLSVNQIRRSLVPLEKLKEGTKRIARREFDSRVRVTSRDEFEEVAESFNTMASQLGRQFKTLTTIAEIDRAILSSLDKARIVDTVLARMREVFPCDSVSVTLFESNGAGTAQTYVEDCKSDKRKQKKTIELRPEDIEELNDNPDLILIEMDGEPPSYLVPMTKLGIRLALVLPIFLRQELSGIIALGYLKPPKLEQEDLDQARQLADQVAVAFSNARLIEELAQLNWGTLRALARAIDAKSHWTAGHSERSTKLALQIGRVVGLNRDELDDLHRAGLLHDIGKLGIPLDVLDKNGKLTAEERNFMDKHPSMGARILEPIDAYAEVIPIVLQHHESFDGTGYPDGLSGEDISLGARIFAVADRFEALTSDRPYRKALNLKRTIKYIKDRAGTEFDPKIVNAFLKVMAQEEKKQEGYR